MSISRTPFKIDGPAGKLQAILQLPAAADYSKFAIVCHPHPLQEGSMHNKVVTTTCKAMLALKIPCLIFNFRGVEQSEGEFGQIKGEVADCMAVVDWINQQYPAADLYLAGFSFGAYIAAEVATKVSTRCLISIAPAVERMPYEQLPAVTCPWLVIMGEEDEVVTPAAVFTWFDTLHANKTLSKFPGTGHFFHGKLLELQRVIEDFVQVY